MDFFSQFSQQIRHRVAAAFIAQQAAVLGVGWALYTFTGASLVEILLATGMTSVLITLLVIPYVVRLGVSPVKSLWQAVQHVAPEGESVPAPNIQRLPVGRELIVNLTSHIYQMANIIQDIERTHVKKIQDVHANFIANSLPLPLFVLDNRSNILYANDAASRYFGVPADELSGKDIDAAISMSFADNQTLTSWLQTSRRGSVTANKTWERVRIGLPGQKDTKLFDLAAHYNKSNPMGYETLLVLFDHTEVYSQDDQAMSFVALTVHELRTPLTLLRGYIEVFDEELGPQLDPELQSFMKKMDAAAQQLTAFVDNILNVAKIEDNQLTLRLHEEKWEDVLRTVVQDLRLRASVRGVTIKASVARNLPSVAVDRYSIYEVVANLLDNAIKYCDTTKEVRLSAVLNADGLIETSISDQGLGIDAAILPHIFDKFYRNHRNRAQIGGTGLGLYLSRAIVRSHGGEIWVSSKVDKGSTFTFTVQPYSTYVKSGKAGTSPSGITRTTHGWVKNHSLYRD